MKKQISKISLKTDKVVNLSKNQTQAVAGGKPKVSKIYCHSDLCTFTGASFSC